MKTTKQYQNEILAMSRGAGITVPISVAELLGEMLSTIKILEKLNIRNREDLVCLREQLIRERLKRA